MAVRIDPEERELDALRHIDVTFDGRHVLEIGCGDGRLTARYARRAASVIAIDPELSMTEIRATCPAWGAHVAFARVPFEAFDAGARRFDVALLSWSL